MISAEKSKLNSDGTATDYEGNPLTCPFCGCNKFNLATGLNPFECQNCRYHMGSY